MNLWQETNWFAIHAKSHQETLACSVVAKLDLEVFLPTIRLEQDVCGVTRLVTKPLFQGYFFARFCPFVSLEAVRHAHGVLRVAGTRQHPLPIESHIMASIQARVQPDGFVRLEPKRFRPGDKVAIERGPLCGWMGRVEREWDDGRRVLILLEVLEQARLLVEKRLLTLSCDED